MNTNVEIEFKCRITEDIYNHLIKEFNLENRIFLQTNYYFDSKDYQLLDKKIILRIRKKSDDYYKITLKTHREYENFEKHVFLTKKKALELIENGFNVSEFFNDIDLPVSHLASLDNYRVNVVYEDGKLFIDKCNYNAITDYEIEYEALDYDKGLKTFNSFLEKHNIPFSPSKKKSQRAFGK